MLYFSHCNTNYIIFADMILRIILQNFLSFNDAVQFDMFPNMKRTTLSSHYNIITPSKDKTLPILKMAAIYGANGAGKSNLLKGISFLKELTTKKTFLNREKVDNYCFKLKSDAGEQPIELTIEFATSAGVIYIYSVEITKTGITYETLQVSGAGFYDNTTIFTRKGDVIEYALKPSNEVQDIIVGWIQRNPFASLLTINEDAPILIDEDIERAKYWFKHKMTVIGINSFNPRLISIFRNNQDVNDFASDLFTEIDLGINKVKVQTEDFDDWINNHGDRDVPIDEMNDMSSDGVLEMIGDRNTILFSMENGVRKVNQILFEQLGRDGYSRDMDIQAQSDGTVRLLSLVPALYAAIEKGQVVIIDEIDHSIHPSLVRELVRYFSKHKTNGQLIFTTHQTCLLNQEFMRTDEVWLVEKKEGSSYMYSLNEFKIHNSINIENGYLEGRYGAIPFVGDLNM